MAPFSAFDPLHLVLKGVGASKLILELRISEVLLCSNCQVDFMYGMESILHQ